jgi:hypothetical protein
VATTWVVGAVALCFGFGSEPVWLALFLGAGVAVAEWHIFQNEDDA